MQCLRDHGRLFENLFLHVVAIIALLYCSSGCTRSGNFALYRIVFAIEYPCFALGDDDPVAFFEISDFLRQRRQRQCIGTKEHLAFAVTHDQRRAEARADQHVRILAERDCEREGSAQFRQDCLHRLFRTCAAFDLFRHQMRNCLGIGVTFQRPAFGDQIIAQLFEIFDDPVVDQCNLAGRVGMRVVRGGRAVRGPAGMRNPDRSGRRIAGQFFDQIVQFALRPAAYQLTVINGADPCTVIAAIFHPLQTID